jgi:hypothetical protein
MLQPLNLLTEWRLRNAKQFSCSGKVLRLSDGNEIT